MDPRPKALLHPGGCRRNIFLPCLHCLLLQLCCLRCEHKYQRHHATAKNVLGSAARRRFVHTSGTAHLCPKAERCSSHTNATTCMRRPWKIGHEMIAQRLSFAEIPSIAMSQGNAWFGLGIFWA